MLLERGTGQPYSAHYTGSVLRRQSNVHVRTTQTQAVSTLMKWMTPSVLIVTLGVAIVILLDSRCNSGKMDSLLHGQWKQNNIQKQYRDRDSAQVTISSANYATKEDLRTSDNEMIQAIRKDLVRPIKTLERTTRILSQRLDSLIIPVRDTVRTVNGVEEKGFTFDYSKPPYLTRMRGVLFGKELALEYDLYSEYQLESHWKPTGLFKPKELEIIIRNPDPAVKVGSVQTFQVVKKVPVWERPGATAAGGLLAGFLVSLSVK